jgi:hypothetical protein
LILARFKSCYTFSCVYCHWLWKVITTSVLPFFAPSISVLLRKQRIIADSPVTNSIYLRVYHIYTVVYHIITFMQWFNYAVQLWILTRHYYHDDFSNLVVFTFLLGSSWVKHHMFHSTQGRGGWCFIDASSCTCGVFFFFFDRIIDGDVLIPPN